MTATRIVLAAPGAAPVVIAVAGVAPIAGRLPAPGIAPVTRESPISRGLPAARVAPVTGVAPSPTVVVPRVAGSTAVVSVARVRPGVAAVSRVPRAPASTRRSVAPVAAAAAVLVIVSARGPRVVRPAIGLIGRTVRVARALSPLGLVPVSVYPAGATACVTAALATPVVRSRVKTACARGGAAAVVVPITHAGLKMGLRSGGLAISTCLRRLPRLVCRHLLGEPAVLVANRLRLTHGQPADEMGGTDSKAKARLRGLACRTRAPSVGAPCRPTPEGLPRAKACPCHGVQLLPARQRWRASVACWRSYWSLRCWRARRHYERLAAGHTEPERRTGRAHLASWAAGASAMTPTAGQGSESTPLSARGRPFSLEGPREVRDRSRTTQAGLSGLEGSRGTRRATALCGKWRAEEGRMRCWSGDLALAPKLVVDRPRNDCAPLGRLCRAGNGLANGTAGARDGHRSRATADAGDCIW